MLKKIRNVIFIGLVSLLLCISLFYLGAKKAGVLPECLDNGDISYLEKNAYLTLDFTTGFQGFIDGKFQKDFEKFASSRIPRHDDWLLAKGEIQFKTIEVSNLIFNYNVIPTFFGSSYSYDRKHDSVVQQSVKKEEKLKKAYNKIAKNINGFAKMNTNLKITQCTPDRISCSSANPTRKLISNSFNNDFKEKQFSKKLREEISHVDLSYKKISEYYDDYYKTDHHWNGIGAMKAYEEIMNQVYPNNPRFEKPQETVFDEPLFWGTYSRSGIRRANVPDKTIDYRVDMRGINIKINGEVVTSEDVAHFDMYDNGTWNKNEFESRYAEFYHEDFAMITFENTNINSNQNLLLIGSSFSNCVDRYFAKSFKNVIEVDPRKCKDSLQGIVSDYQITDVIIMIDDATLTQDRVAKFFTS